MSKEYLFNGDYVTIHSAVAGGRYDLVIVANDREELLVARKDMLQPKEESWGYRRAEERKKELQLITANAQENLDKLTDKLVNKALKSLSTRMKMNVLFGQDLTSANGWAMTVIAELEKMVKEEAKDVIKNKKEVDREIAL